MNQFKTILKFELKGYLKNKVFVGVTVMLVVLIAAVMFFPRISEAFDKSDDYEIVTSQTDTSQETQTQEGEYGDFSADGDLPVMLISAKTSNDAELIKQNFSPVFADYDVRITYENLDKIKDHITQQEAQCAFVFSSLTSYIYYVNDLSMYDASTQIADEVLENVNRLSAMIENGISAEKAQELMYVEITGETQSLGADQMNNFFYTYIMVFALYMVILMYGQMIATNVATEKSSRAMELLITSAKPVSMMFGKIIASCIAGLLQLIAVFGSSYVMFNINKSYWGDNEIINSIFNMPINLLIYMLIFFVLGFLIYAFLYGAVGSTVSKLEDINTAVMPVTILFIIGFLVVVFSMSSSMMDNVLIKVCSYIPFTSPMSMFARVAMSTVPFYEIAISIAVLVVSVIAIGIISAKIYKMGVLLYGTRPKLKTIIRAIKNHK